MAKILHKVIPPTIDKMLDPESWELKFSGIVPGLTDHVGSSVRRVLRGWTEDHLSVTGMIRAYRSHGFNFSHKSKRTAERTLESVGQSKFALSGTAKPIAEFSFGIHVDCHFCMRAVYLFKGSPKHSLEWVQDIVPVKVWTGNRPEDNNEMSVEKDCHDIIVVVVQLTPIQFIRICKTGTITRLESTEET